MKNRSYIWLCVFAIIITAGIWLFKRPAHLVLNSPPILVTTNSTGFQSIQKSTSGAKSTVQTNISGELAVAVKAYREGKITKEEAMDAEIIEQNKKNQDFYGKIVDQYGSPVAGATVTGNLINETGYYKPAKVDTYITQSDVDGQFQFVGLHGSDFNVKVKKEGYIVGLKGEGYKGSIGSNSNPNDRAVFIIWKPRGAESLISFNINANIPHDGTAIAFETATGKQSPDGDFRIILSQFPLEIKNGRERFDWAVKTEIINGGLMEENDPYPYWAPANNYQPSFEFNVSSNAPEWVPNLKKNFYIKNAQGQYGIIQFSVFPGRSPTGIEVNFIINPSGSQNLELPIQE